MSDPQTLGLLATYRSGISSLRASGQDDRFIRHYLTRYAGHFKRIYYFSYLSENTEEVIQDPVLRQAITILPRRWKIPSFIYGLLIPIAYPREFSDCSVFRVFQALGVLPLLNPVAWCKKALITFGYRYAEFARIEGKAFYKVWLLRALEWLAVKRATVLLVTTLELYRHLQPYRGTRTIAWIPNGVDPEQFHPVDQSSNAPIQTLLFVGRLERQKNLEHLLRAAARLTDVPPLRWLWMGEGSLKPSLEALAQQLSIPLEIRKPVSHSALAAAMREADAFTLVSLKEGHPKVLIEAMSTALPCLVTPCDGTRTLIEDGRNGIVCEGFDTTAIEIGLRRLLQNPTESRRLGLAARDTAVKHYDLRRWIDAECAILSSIARGPREDWQWTRVPRGFALSRWLDYSVRRRGLDQAMAGAAPLLKGRLLEVGGGRNAQRGRFIRPWWQTDSWEMLNRDPRANPDHLSDIENTRLDKQSFDTILAMEMLEYTNDPDRALRCMAALLKPQGRLVLSMPYAHAPDQLYDRWRFSADELRKRIETSGLRVESVQSQGGLLGSCAHRLKSLASRPSSRITRWILGILLFPVVELLRVGDPLVNRLPIFRRAPTGLLAIAMKPAK